MVRISEKEGGPTNFLLVFCKLYFRYNMFKIVDFPTSFIPITPTTRKSVLSGSILSKHLATSWLWEWIIRFEHFIYWNSWVFTKLTGLVGISSSFLDICRFGILLYIGTTSLLPRIVGVLTIITVNYFSIVGDFLRIFVSHLWLYIK